HHRVPDDRHPLRPGCDARRDAKAGAGGREQRPDSHERGETTAGKRHGSDVTGPTPNRRRAVSPTGPPSVGWPASIPAGGPVDRRDAEPAPRPGSADAKLGDIAAAAGLRRIHLLAWRDLD